MRPNLQLRGSRMRYRLAPVLNGLLYELSFLLRSTTIPPEVSTLKQPYILDMRDDQNIVISFIEADKRTRKHLIDLMFQLGAVMLSDRGSSVGANSDLVASS